MIGDGMYMYLTIRTGDLPLGLGFGSTEFVMNKSEVAGVDTGETCSVKGSIM